MATLLTYLMLIHGVVFGITFIPIGVVLGLLFFISNDVNLLVKQIISILGLFLIYFIWIYFLYFEFELSMASTIKEKSFSGRIFFYLKELNLYRMKEFWPLFKERITVIDFLLMFGGIQSSFYFKWKYFTETEFVGLTEDEETARKSSDSLNKVRKVNSRRFRRRF